MPQGKPKTRGKRGRKDPTKSKGHLMQFRVNDALKAIMFREARKDGRPMANLIRKLCTEALEARGAFAATNVQ